MIPEIKEKLKDMPDDGTIDATNEDSHELKMFNEIRYNFSLGTTPRKPLIEKSSKYQDIFMVSRLAFTKMQTHTYVSTFNGIIW